ncbi:MAG: glycoside hydrolase family 15 protein [Firmicutes bacterium]|nr:glycoside hydrolase family 15 protein [Bacillota bacterium]
MPRPLTIGNGRLLISFDEGLNMRDLYYPRVGFANHIGGHYGRLGLWVEGNFSWLDEKGWERRLAYQPQTLVTQVKVSRPSWGLELAINDAVHVREDIYLKKIVLYNLKNAPQEVRLFFSHDLDIDESDVGDTALYDPRSGGIYHYKRDKYFLMNGQVIHGDGRTEGPYQFATGTKRFGGGGRNWRDAEDGQLEGNPIAQGSVDSTLSFRLFLPTGGKALLYYWLVVGDRFQEVQRKNALVLADGPKRLLRETQRFWRRWVNKEKTDFLDLPEPVQELFKLSLLLIRTHIDQAGAIIAATDTDIMKTNRDHYGYVWPRDGALVTLALNKAGYLEPGERFFRFIRRIITDEGYLLHKYNPDGSLGSSWHPWYRDGSIQLPIQEDSTALVLYVLWDYYQRTRNLELLDELYLPLIRPAADFLVTYRDSETGLPLPSYDLWEERRGVFSYTAATVSAGLFAASAMAGLLGDLRSSRRYRCAARQVQDGLERHLYSEDLGRFLRGYYRNVDGTRSYDFTLESSLAGLFLYGTFPASDERVAFTLTAVEKGLWVKTAIGGLARYTNDYYFQKSHDLEKVPGNPWFITTLWLAQWYIARASTRSELELAKPILLWVTSYAMESGVLSEQIHPYTGQSLSVAPLIWSHAAFVEAVMDYLEKYKRLVGKQPRPTAGLAGR